MTIEGKARVKPGKSETGRNAEQRKRSRHPSLGAGAGFWLGAKQGGMVI
jgi:hypothetical protein